MNANEYQNKIADILRNIFGNDLVKTEWDSVTCDGHTANHTKIYAPRHDIAIGPFNSYADLDIGIDRTWNMRKHPFTKELINKELKHREVLDKVWNKYSRCFLAIEIEFSGSSKHTMGSIINAVVSGSIGIIITTEERMKKVNRIYKYVLRLENLGNLEINVLRNLIIFNDKQFLELLNKFDK